MGVDFTREAAERIMRGVRRIEGASLSYNTPPPRNPRRPRSGTSNTVLIFQAPGGGVPAISGSTLGSADCTPYYVTSAGVRSELLDKDGQSQTFTVYNQFSTAIGANNYFMAIWAFGRYLAINDDCD